MIHTITLTRHGMDVARNVQALHGLMREAFNSEPHLWAHPRRDTIIARSDSTPQHMSRYMRDMTSREETTPGDTVRFSLIGHPVKRHEGRERLIEGTAVTDWARDRLAPGIIVDEIAAQTLRPRYGHRWGRRITLHAVLFTGVGTVADRDHLQRMLTDGVGRAKAYGFGLLVVADRGRP